MSTIEQQARDFAAANPTRDGGSWAGWCASMEYRFNGASVAYENATAAGDAANIESTDASEAPIGAIHYWNGAGGDGHVATEVGGRGRKLFMASSKVDEDLGTAIGFISFDSYQAKTGLPYRGWARTYGVNPAQLGDDSGQYGDPTPAPTPDPAPSPSGNTYTVVEGDTLWDIAESHLGDATRWPEIYALNAAVIGDNPDLILPGQVLTLP